MDTASMQGAAAHMLTHVSMSVNRRGGRGLDGESTSAGCKMPGWLQNVCPPENSHPGAPG
eukprot:COSAG01_NODE_74200_length_223_cov_4.564516_1_plen_59_part_10